MSSAKAVELVRVCRPAMACHFELILMGEDSDHLQAVGVLALDEISRLARVLSRHDPAGEIARINREAHAKPVRVDREVFAILSELAVLCERSGGRFNPLASVNRTVPPFGEVVRLDPERRTVHLDATELAIDLGGFGKGYALDAAAAILRDYGVESALLSGGTSSIVAIGLALDASPWPVGLRDPADEKRVVTTVTLTDEAMSCSAMRGIAEERSDVLDPFTGRALSGRAGCAVVAPSGAVAESLSTAILVGGSRCVSERLQRFASAAPGAYRAAWIEPGGQPSWTRHEMIA